MREFRRFFRKIRTVFGAFPVKILFSPSEAELAVARARNSLAIALGSAHGLPHMKSYRAYAVWPNGNFEGYEALICVDDDEAIGAARRLADKSAIELWSGERFITRLEHKSR
jgi:hypothetical protein